MQVTYFGLGWDVRAPLDEVLPVCPHPTNLLEEVVKHCGPFWKQIALGKNDAIVTQINYLLHSQGPTHCLYYYLCQFEGLGLWVCLVRARDERPEVDVKLLTRVSCHCTPQAPHQREQKETLQPQCDLEEGRQLA